MADLNLKELKHKNLLPLINKAKDYIKSTDTLKKLFDKYDLDIDYVDHIPVVFSDIDTSAKTEGGIIYLSFKLLEDKDFYKDYSYLAHEITHFIQQCFSDEATECGDEHYLDNEFEVEGFQNQVEFLKEEFGEEEAEKYTDGLLEYHDYKESKKNKKKKELLSGTE